MSHGNSRAMRRGAVRAGIGLAALLLGVGCSESSKDPNADPAVAPPMIVTPPMKSNDPSAPSAETAIELPKPDPGGQSGSDSEGSTPCAEEREALAGGDATPWGPTLAVLDADARELLEQKPVTLTWVVADWMPTALRFVLELDPGATLVTSANGCSDRIVQAARLHLRSDDGLFDDELEAQLDMVGDETRVYFNLRAELAGDELAASALGAALVERRAVTGLSLDANDDVTVMLSYAKSEQNPVSGLLQLSWRDDDGIELIDVASIDGSQPAPSPRVAIEPPPALAGSCVASSPTLPLEPPTVAYDDRLSALAGTWILCGGDRAEPVAIDHVGLVIADDGRFVQVVQDQDGALREGTGFAREGTIEINDAVMGGLDPNISIQTRSVVVRELLLHTSAGLVQGSSRRLELSADGESMRWVVDSELGVQLELVYQRSELPVSAAPASSFQPGELAGAAACGAEERGLQALQSRADWQGAFGGRWTWCSGAPDAATGGTLELDDAGGFRQLNAAGLPLIAGSYALVRGISPELVYLQLTPDAGVPWTIFGMRSSETPRKLLVATAVDAGSFRVGVLSATP